MRNEHFWKICGFVLILVNVILIVTFGCIVADKKITSKQELIEVNPNFKNYISTNDPYIGSPRAPVTVIVYNDFESPFCSKFYKSTYEQIKKDYVDTGKVKLVYRNLPLVNIHKDSLVEAEAFECANEQNEAFEMLDFLYKEKRSTVDEILENVNVSNLNFEAFEECLISGKYKDKILIDVQDAFSQGIQDAPTLVIGDEIIEGMKPYKIVKNIIDEKLGK